MTKKITIRKKSVLSSNIFSNFNPIENSGKLDRQFSKQQNSYFIHI